MDDAKEKGQKEITAYLDRIEELEDGTAEAVFLFEDEEDDFIEFVLPTDYLPKSADEGEYLTINITRSDKEIADEGAVTVAEDECPLPTDFLPEGTSAYLTIKISRDEDKTTEALDEARELLKNLEE